MKIEIKELKEKRIETLSKLARKEHLKYQKLAEQTIEKYGNKAIEKFQRDYIRGNYGIAIWVGFFNKKLKIEIIRNYLSQLYPEIEFYTDIDWENRIYWR